MGLDIVEYVLAVEGALDIDIPDKDAEGLETPRILIDYLCRRLDAAGDRNFNCLSQRAFYRARNATSERFDLDRRSLRPETVLADVMSSRTSEWKALGTDIGSTEWPRLKSDNWVASRLGGVSTLGELAKHLSTYDVAAMRNPDAAWTRQEIQAVVLNLLEIELGVDMRRYTLDSRFVRDMGLD
jgi:hypothetical protein